MSCSGSPLEPLGQSLGSELLHGAVVCRCTRAHSETVPAETAQTVAGQCPADRQDGRLPTGMIKAPKPPPPRHLPEPKLLNDPERRPRRHLQRLGNTIEPCPTHAQFRTSSGRWRGASPTNWTRSSMAAVRDRLGLNPGMWSAALDQRLPADIANLLFAKTGVAPDQLAAMTLSQDLPRQLLLPLRYNGDRNRPTPPFGLALIRRLLSMPSAAGGYYSTMTLMSLSTAARTYCAWIELLANALGRIRGQPVLSEGNEPGIKLPDLLGAYARMSSDPGRRLVQELIGT